MRWAGLCLAAALSERAVPSLPSAVSGSRARAQSGREELLEADLVEQEVEAVSWPAGPLLLPLAAALLALRGAQGGLYSHWSPHGQSGDVSLGMLAGIALRGFSPNWSLGGPVFASAVLPGLVLRTWNRDLLGAARTASKQPLPWLLVVLVLPVVSSIVCGSALRFVLASFGVPLELADATLVFACLNVNGGGAVARIFLQRDSSPATAQALLLLWWLGMGLTGPLFRSFAEDRRPILGLAADVSAGVFAGVQYAYGARSQLRWLQARGSGDRLLMAVVLSNAYLCFSMQAAWAAFDFPSAEVLSVLVYVAGLKYLLEQQGGFGAEFLVSEATEAIAAWSDTCLFGLFGLVAGSVMTFRELQVGLVGAACVWAGGLLAMPCLAALRADGSLPSVARLYCARNAVWVACHAHPRLTLDTGERLWAIAVVIHALSIAAVQLEQLATETWPRKQVVSELGAELL